MGILDLLLRFSTGFMGGMKNKAIKSVAKQRTRLLINYLEDGAVNKGQIDFFLALKDYMHGEKIQCPIDNITSDDCTKWSELFILIVWKETKAELSYDPTMGAASDFQLLSSTVLSEINQWEKTIKTRA